MHLFLLWLAALFSACSYAPVQEMSDARQAIQAARLAGAEKSAPMKLRQAERLLDQAVAELEEGGYDSARQKAKAAWSAAVEARKASEVSPLSP